MRQGTIAYRNKNGEFQRPAVRIRKEETETDPEAFADFARTLWMHYGDEILKTEKAK